MPILFIDSYMLWKLLKLSKWCRFLYALKNLRLHYLIFMSFSLAIKKIRLTEGFYILAKRKIALSIRKNAYMNGLMRDIAIGAAKKNNLYAFIANILKRRRKMKRTKLIFLFCAILCFNGIFGAGCSDHDYTHKHTFIDVPAQFATCIEE